MAATQIGAGLIVGATTTLTIPNVGNYVVVSCTEGSKELDSERIDTAEGALSTILHFNEWKTANLTLICKASATPESDFPPNTEVDFGTGDYWFIQSVSIDRNKTPHQVNLTLLNSDLTT